MESSPVALVICEYLDDSDDVFLSLPSNGVGCSHGLVNFIPEEVPNVTTSRILWPQTPRDVVSRIGPFLQCAQHTINLSSRLARRKRA